MGFRFCCNWKTTTSKKIELYFDSKKVADIPIDF